MSERVSPSELLNCVEIVDPSTLQLLDGNPNVGDVDAISGSFEQFGQLEFLLVRDGVVWSGNHRVQSAIARDEHEIAVINLDKLERELSDEFMRSAAVALNAIARRAQWDEPALGEWLLTIAAEDESLIASLGLDDDEIEDALALLIDDEDEVELGDDKPDVFPADTVRISIGDYRGVISVDTYRAFRDVVERRREQDVGAVLSDILAELFKEIGAHG